MGKYDPLRDYLRSQTLSEMTPSFREIEKIIGEPLPNSAVRPQWWATQAEQASIAKHPPHIQPGETPRS